MRALMWFRADLRVEDNAALTRATRESSNGVIAVFVICPAQWRDEHDWAPVKADFVLRSLEALNEELGTLGIPLLIRTQDRFDAVPQLLAGLAHEHTCDAIYFNEEYEVNERARDEAVASVFIDAGRQVHACHDQTVLPPGSVRTGDGGFYGVYSPFKRKCYAMIEQQGGIELHASPKKQQPIPGIASDSVPATIEGYDLGEHDRWAELWPAGEREARKALGLFIRDRIAEYKVDRDFPALPATSNLSHHLAAGTISARQCVVRAAEANNGRLAKGGQGEVHWISEVLWREFYKHITVGYPRVCKGRAFQLDTERLRWSDNDEHFEAWTNARTGVPIVDAAIRQMLQTGWMHNRVRMIAAMFLTKNLFIDWRRGERFFMRNLIDGDLASNNGGWQWSASTGTDAAPYFRIMNPVSQSRKFDPEGVYLRRYLPELADLDDETIHEPYAKSSLFGSIEYPEPIVDLKQSRADAIERFKALKRE